MISCFISVNPNLLFISVSLQLPCHSWFPLLIASRAADFIITPLAYILLTLLFSLLVHLLSSAFESVSKLAPLICSSGLQSSLLVSALCFLVFCPALAAPFSLIRIKPFTACFSPPSSGGSAFWVQTSIILKSWHSPINGWKTVSVCLISYVAKLSFFPFRFAQLISIFKMKTTNPCPLWVWCDGVQNGI